MCVKDSECLVMICLLMVVIKQCEVDDWVMFDDVGIMVVIDKMIKQCKDLISQFQVVGCDDFVVKEQVELIVLGGYMFV